MVYDANLSDEYVILFGGEGRGGAFGDTWLFRNENWTNITPNVPNATNTPSPRYGAAMAYDSSDGNVVLFGGASGPFTGSNDPLLNDTWTFNQGNWTRVCVSCMSGVSEPGPRFQSSASDDPSDSGVVLFGGLSEVDGSYATLNDTWVFAHGSWTLDHPGTSPPARYGAGLSLNSTTGPVVLFGGCSRPLSGGGPNCAAPLNDSWAFSANVWTEIVAGQGRPGARLGFGFVYSAKEGEELAFGGLSASGLLNETWELAQGTWTDLTNTLLSSPSPRDNVALTYDPATGTNYFILYGGWNGTYVDETWVYPSPFSPLRVSAPVANATVTDVGRPIRLNVTITGGAGGYNRTWLGLPPGCETSNTSSLVCHPQTPVTLSASYTISVRVRDARGSIVWSASTTIRVNAQPTAAIAGAPSNVGTVPWNMTFTATVYGGTAPFDFAWDFGDGTANGTGSPVTHEYSAVGRFIVNVSVTDYLGVSAPITSYAVRTAPPIEVQLSVNPNSTASGSSVTFEAQASGGFPPYSYVWSGLPSSCATVNNATFSCFPSTAGTYVVSVRVTDKYEDTVNASSTLVVRSEASSLGPLGASSVLVGVGVAVVSIAAVTVFWAVRRSRREKSRPSQPQTPRSPGPPPTP